VRDEACIFGAQKRIGTTIPTLAQPARKLLKNIIYKILYGSRTKISVPPAWWNAESRGIGLIYQFKARREVLSIVLEGYTRCGVITATEL